jgi:uncharacterized membrane protein YqaE (UPF0057 family)
MLRSKSFWIGVAIFIPFLIVWIMEGFGWAIVTLVIMGLVFLFFRLSVGASRRKRRYYYDDDDYDEGYDEVVHVTRPRGPRGADIQRGLDLHVPKVNKKGAEFISGSGNLRRRQQGDLKRIRKNLWGQ